VPDGAFVVVAAAPDRSHIAVGELRARGASAVEERAVAPGRALVYARFADDGSAGRVVADLRSRGWPAVVRPVGGGHLAAWHANTRPVVVDDRLWVCFPWTEVDRPPAGVLVEIDPGPAFGAGGHPSTRLLLVELVRRMHGGESVLDVGCGSGVLSVSAARLGAASVTAVDVDDRAVASTRANATRNDVGATVAASTTPVAEVTGTFDVIVANIGAATLVELAPALEPRLAAGGWLGLSGLSPAQVSVVSAAYPSTRVVATPIDGDWAAVVVTLPLTPTSGPRPASRPTARSRRSPRPGC
jgi:ribosomal protein L11 methyltransferase